MKTVTKAIAIFAIAAFCTTAALAAEGGNPKKGKYLFKKNCKACHVDGAEGGVLTPMKKTQGQWDRFFGKNGKTMGERAGGLGDQDLKDIQQYLFDHAADSDQPETCG